MNEFDCKVYGQVNLATTTVLGATTAGSTTATTTTALSFAMLCHFILVVIYSIKKKK